MKNIDTFYMSEKQIEQMKRKRKWNKKMTKSAILFLAATASVIALEFVPNILLDAGMAKLGVDYISLALQGIGGIGGLCGVCSFAKALHDPLTEKEAEEFDEKEVQEKGGFSK